MEKTLIVLLVIFLLNIVFGYWRSNTRRFSLQWIAAIHVPVIIGIGLRLAFLSWHWVQLPFFVIAFAAGQYIGGWMRPLLKNASISPGSFLIADLARIMLARYKSDI